MSIALQPRQAVFQPPNNHPVSAASQIQNIDWTTAQTYTINFYNTSGNAFGNVKSIQYDNTLNPSDVTIIVGNTEQVITLPAYTSGVVGVIALDSSTFEMYSAGTATGRINMVFNNFPLQGWQSRSGSIVQVDLTGPIPAGTNVIGKVGIDQTTPGVTNGVYVNNVYPTGATQVNATSGNVANDAAVAALPAVPAKTNYVTGFEITGAGATAASVVVATLVGLLGANASFIYSVVAGATLRNESIIVEFSKPIPASAPNAAITLTLPALGAGNTNACVNIHGYVV